MPEGVFDGRDSDARAAGRIGSKSETSFCLPVVAFGRVWSGARETVVVVVGCSSDKRSVGVPLRGLNFIGLG